jgi:PIN domain nuclease of toxin-antitoxin system
MTNAVEPLLLDTHVWIWLNEGGAELTDSVVRRIGRAAAHGCAFVSVMSVWEVGLLHATQRVALGLSLPIWVQRALAPPITAGALTPEIAMSCLQLPGQFHSDPIDRILVATARIEELTLVTRDRAILDYAAQGHVRALPCWDCGQLPLSAAQACPHCRHSIGLEPFARFGRSRTILSPPRRKAWPCGSYSSVRSC